MAGPSKNAPRNSSLAQLRIIGGRWRGRKLSFLEVDGLRPTGDRIRETLFNWLMADLVQARVLDLFSGAGSLGFESASRSAAEVVMIERHPKAAEQLCENAKLLQADSVKIVNCDALQWLRSEAEQPFDVVFVDPPFSLDLWSESFELLEAGNYLQPGTAIYVECDRGKALAVPANWRLHREKNAGKVSFRLYYRQ